ncbi:MAG TPA: hypothetical protein VF580_02695, partial [Thermoanaerobaculia bacterium]
MAHGNDLVQFLPVTEGPGGPKPIDVSLSVTPAAHVTVPSLPVGGVLQALDERTAELRSQPV